MALGIVVAIALILLVVYQTGRLVYLKGCLDGTHQEAKQWLEAIDKVTPPNWQSLPIQSDSLEKAKLEEANKVYAAAFKIALGVIREEIAVNRLAAMLKDMEAVNE